MFPALPGTKQEIKFLGGLRAALFPELACRTLSGSTATEQSLRQLAAGQQIIHLATHGFFAPPEVISIARNSDPQRDQLQFLSFGADRDNPSRGAIGYPPGVVLVGANQPLPEGDFTSDDDIFTAFEVQELNLDGTELVVLSASETGLGQVAGGEGVLGLQLASIWRVLEKSSPACGASMATPPRQSCSCTTTTCGKKTTATGCLAECATGPAQQPGCDR